MKHVFPYTAMLGLALSSYLMVALVGTVTINVAGAEWNSRVNPSYYAALLYLLSLYLLMKSRSQAAKIALAALAAAGLVSGCGFIAWLVMAFRA